MTEFVEVPKVLFPELINQPLSLIDQCELAIHQFLLEQGVSLPTTAHNYNLWVDVFESRLTPNHKFLSVLSEVRARST